MPVVITTVLRSHVGIDRVRQVEAQIGDVKPYGRIAHPVSDDEQTHNVLIVDTWESEKARDEFARAHVGPVLRRIAAAPGDSSPAPVSSEAAETSRFVRGRP